MVKCQGVQNQPSKIERNVRCDGFEKNTVGLFTIGKSDRFVRSDRNKMQFFKNNSNLEFKCKDC